MAVTAARQIVVFSLSGEDYALPINAVSEIIRYTQPRSVASVVPGVLGVIGLRGKVIPVFELAGRLQLSPSESAPDKIVIVETGNGHVGVIVNEVDEVRTITPEQTEGVPTSTSDAIDTIVKVGDRLIVLLDPERLLTVTAEEIALSVGV